MSALKSCDYIDKQEYTTTASIWNSTLTSFLSGDFNNAYYWALGKGAAE